MLLSWLGLHPVSWAGLAVADVRYVDGCSGQPFSAQIEARVHIAR
ncbi:hypothetical protein [Parazoarcus communis]|nr:hypothetical protein [Parazoarcus communis]